MKQKKVSSKKTKTSKSTKPKTEGKFQHYLGVFMENVDSKFKQIMESFTTLATREALQRVEDEVKDVKFRVQIIEEVVIDHSSKLQQLMEQKADKKDLERLEAKLEQKADKKDLEQLNHKVEQLSNGMDNLSNRMDNLSNKMDQISNTMATKDDIREIKSVLTDHQQRLINLEQRS